MSEQNFTATQMVWQPPMLRLTRVQHPDLNGGKPENAYVRPDLIATIQSTWVCLEKMSGGPERHPPVLCSLIALTTGGYIHVSEPPDVIAMQRDRALGYHQRPQAI